MNIKNRGLLIAFILIVLNCTHIYAEETNAIIGNEALPYKGSGTQEDPNVYLFNDESKVTWKHLNNNKSESLYEVYENREGDTSKGRLKYSWTIEPDKLTTAEGPYFLGINFYSGDKVKNLYASSEGFYFSFGHKRDFAGSALITMYVGDKYKDDAALRLYYYGGYNSTIVHGASPIILPDEILDKDELKKIAEGVTVQNGYVQFTMRYGGNYFLTEKFDEGSVAGAEELKFGTASSMFKTPAIAQAVAKAMGKDMNDEITQGDIDSIKNIYIDASNISDISELGEYTFSRIERLTIINNNLSKIAKLNMPMLVSLDLSNNQIVDCSAISSLITVENINLSNNKIKNLPDLSALTKLTTLVLSNNEVEILPDLNTSSLRYLDLENNKINKILNMETMTSLERINLKGNEVTQIPNFLYQNTDVETEIESNVLVVYNEENNAEKNSSNTNSVTENDIIPTTTELTNTEIASEQETSSPTETKYTKNSENVRIVEYIAVTASIAIVLCGVLIYVFKKYKYKKV